MRAREAFRLLSVLKCDAVIDDNFELLRRVVSCRLIHRRRTVCALLRTVAVICLVTFFA